MRNERGSGVVGLSIGLTVVLVLAGMLVVGGLWFYGYMNALRTEGINRETQLSAQYQSNQNYLSAYISGFYEQLGVANLKSEKLDQILTDAVKGRYETSGGFSADGAFFAAVVEAYPDLTALNIYDKVVDYVAGGRTGYREVQDKLLDMLRSYDAWRGDGIVQSRIVSSMLGVPSDRLEARLPSGDFTGTEARRKMYEIVLASDAQKAYETGTMDPLSVPRN